MQNKDDAKDGSSQNVSSIPVIELSMRPLAGTPAVSQTAAVTSSDAPNSADFSTDRTLNITSEISTQPNSPRNRLPQKDVLNLGGDHIPLFLKSAAESESAQTPRTTAASSTIEFRDDFSNLDSPKIIDTYAVKLFMQEYVSDGTDFDQTEEADHIKGLVNKQAVDIANEEDIDKQNFWHNCSNRQINLIISSFLVLMGAMLAGTTMGSTDMDWWVWQTILIIGNWMFISCVCSIIFISFCYWDFDEFKISYSHLSRVEAAHEIQKSIEQLKRRRRHKYKHDRLKIIEETQQRARERMEKNWENGDMLTDFWILHDDDLEPLYDTTPETPRWTFGQSQKKCTPRSPRTPGSTFPSHESQDLQECQSIFRRLSAAQQEYIVESHARQKAWDNQLIYVSEISSEYTSLPHHGSDLSDYVVEMNPSASENVEGVIEELTQISEPSATKKKVERGLSASYLLEQSADP